MVSPTPRRCTSTKEEQGCVRAEDGDDNGRDDDTGKWMEGDCAGFVVVDEPLRVCDGQRGEMGPDVRDAAVTYRSKDSPGLTWKSARTGTEIRGAWSR